MSFPSFKNHFIKLAIAPSIIGIEIENPAYIHVPVPYWYVIRFRTLASGTDHTVGRDLSTAPNATQETQQTYKSEVERKELVVEKKRRKRKSDRNTERTKKNNAYAILRSRRRSEATALRRSVSVSNGQLCPGCLGGKKSENIKCKQGANNYFLPVYVCMSVCRCVYLCVDAGPSNPANPTNQEPISTNPAATDVPIFLFVRSPPTTSKTVLNS